MVLNTCFYNIPENKDYYISSTSLNENSLRDETSEEGILNGGFKVYNQSSVLGIGLTSSEETQAQIEDRTLTAELAELAGNGYKEGDVVNYGYISTLRMIKHRNIIINNDVYPIEPDFSLNLQIPQASADGLYTELESLTRLMTAIQERMRDEYGETNYAKWSQLYYPSASACYAYEPTVKLNEKLADKYKKHNWFLPSTGMLARLCYYDSIQMSLNNHSAYTRIFTETETNANYMSHIERNEYEVLTLLRSSSASNRYQIYVNIHKYQSTRVRPFIAI